MLESEKEHSERIQLVADQRIHLDQIVRVHVLSDRSDKQIPRELVRQPRPSDVHVVNLIADVNLITRFRIDI